MTPAPITQQEYESRLAKAQRLRAVLFLTIASAGSLLRADDQLWTYDGGFHEKIAAADRLVVRPRIFRPDEEYDQEFIEGHSRPIFVVQDAAELRSVAAHLKFKSPQKVQHYFFRRYPILEWYRGDEKLATAASKVNCLGAADFGGDVELTTDSASWVADWLADHGFEWTREKLDRYLHREAVAAKARPVLAAHTPPEVPRARAQAETAVEDWRGEDWYRRQDASFDQHLRAAFADRSEMYQKLFRLVGCLPMVWDSLYQPTQRDAYEFLGRSPREELDRAFQNALRSEDNEAIRGAVWVLFVEIDIDCEDEFADEGDGVFPRTGVTEADLARWFSMFAGAAYADPFPQNRRVLLDRLVEYPQAAKLSLLQAALADPDQTVRRRAIEVLWKRGGESEPTLLQEMAAGMILPRGEVEPPMDYGEGTSEGWVLDNDAEEFSSTDQEAAEVGISQIASERRRRREAAAVESAP